MSNAVVWRNALDSGIVFCALLWAMRIGLASFMVFLFNRLHFFR